MKQLSFYKIGKCLKREYIKGWPNWTGEIPQNGDIVKLHFGDRNETEIEYRVLYRVIDDRHQDTIDIIVTEIE